MKALRVRHHDAEINVSFSLNRFIADWPSAQSKFIRGIADGFREWFPRDFRVAPAFAIEDLRCKCRLLGGQCEIVLGPELLQLDFENVEREERDVVEEVIRKASEWLVTDLGDHGRDLFSFQTFAHVEALEAEAVDAYLGQFAPAGVDELMRSEPEVQYLPSGYTALSGEKERWRLRRVVEKSAIKNTLFVDTRVHVTYPDSPDSIGSNDLMRLLARVEKLADRAVGFGCEDE